MSKDAQPPERLGNYIRAGIIANYRLTKRRTAHEAFGPAQPLTYDHRTMLPAPSLGRPRGRALHVCRGTLPFFAALACAFGCAANASRDAKSSQALQAQVEQLQRDYDRLAERVGVVETRAPTDNSGASSPAGLPVVKLLPGAEVSENPVLLEPAPALGKRPLSTPDDPAERLVISGTGADLKTTEPKSKSSAARAGTP